MKEKLRRNNFLRNKKSFIFLLILCLGVGFAFLSTQLNITGNTSVSGNKWSVYFNKVDITEGSVEATVEPTVTGTTTTSLNYTVNLDKPGDFYEFTVEAKNDGTIDAMIDSINLTTLNSNVAKYLNYTATYINKTELAQNDILEAKTSDTYIIRVEFKRNISAVDLDEDGVELNLSFGVNYVQSTFKKFPSEFAKLVSSSAQSDIGIDFTSNSSDSNGKGLYVKNGTESATYPIYYYRGDVSNNNAKFAGFCWKIVRTTETGGTKLIYNGLPDGEGNCSNTTGEATQLSGTTPFNENYTSPAYNGYMYGIVYDGSDHSTNSGYIYGSDFTYSNGTYTLKGVQSELDSTHHYTCFNSNISCAELLYVYALEEDFFHEGNPPAYYITLTNGKSVEDAMDDMITNTNDSTVKTVIDNWFSTTFMPYFTELEKNYNNFLEDTIWCNDRSMNELGTEEWAKNSGWNPNGGNLNNILWYSSYGRRTTGTPRLDCPNKNDSFTVDESKKGNGALDYPVGLLTADEVVLAGGQSSANDTYYLYTNQLWWTMSPNRYDYTNTMNFAIHNDGRFDYCFVEYLGGGVRPSISLRPEVKIAEGGNGTSTKPYEFVVE